MNPARLLEYFDRIAEAPDAIPRLRRFILDLAVRGKLVEQDPNDEPASELLKKIQAEKQSLVKAGKLKTAKPLKALSDEDLPFGLPSGWQWSQLAQIGAINPRNQAASDFSASFVPMKLIPAEYGIQHTHEVRPWSEICSGFTHFSEGDVALAKITPCFENGKSTVFRRLTGAFGAGTTELHVVRPVFVDADYLLIFLKCPYFIDTGIPQMTGTAGQKRVSTEYFAYSPFPLPPLAEQHRIVAKVDELMALCDRLEATQAKRESRRDRLASASLKRISQPEDVGNGEVFRKNVRFHLNHLPRLTTRLEHIKELRQTILNLAVRGKLVPQDPNDEPASELLNKIQAEKDNLTKTNQRKKNVPFAPNKSETSHYALPPSWIWIPFGQIMLSRDGERVPVSKEERNSREKLFDYYGASGVIDKIDGYLFEKPLLLIGEDGANLINRSSPIAFIARGKYWVNNHAHVLDGTSEEFLRYIELFINAIDLKPYVTGTAQPKMNQAKMNTIPVALPPENEQHRIVAKVDELMALCDQLEAQINSSQVDRSRLLEATLCEALGMSKMPSPRAGRTASSRATPAPRQAERPLQAVKPRLVEPAHTAPQRSIADQPKPASDSRPQSAPEAILAQMKPGHDYSRAQICDALGLSVYEWNMAIRELKENGQVIQTGEKRGARYRLS